MKVMRIISAMVATLFILSMPAIALAYPFGGQASIVIPCFDDAIYANLGAPAGGPFVWTPATETFRFGPPTHAGQWLLGTAGPLYLCLVSIDPIFTLPATAILMMGSSQ